MKSHGVEFFLFGVGQFHGIEKPFERIRDAFPCLSGLEAAASEVEVGQSVEQPASLHGDGIFEDEDDGFAGP